jgi:hypothetical protein
MINRARMSVTRIKFLLLALLSVLSGCAHRKALEEGCYDGLRNRCVELAEELLQNREEGQAVYWLARGCDLGHWGSCLRHASLYQWGWGVEQDWPRARGLYNATCQHKVREACRARDLLDELDKATQCRPMDLETFGATMKQIAKLQHDSLKFCTQLRAERAAMIDMKLEVRIGTDGRARSAAILANTRPDLRVAECARDQVLKWHFPCPPQELRFTIPITFAPLE